MTLVQAFLTKPQINQRNREFEKLSMMSVTEGAISQLCRFLAIVCTCCLIGACSSLSVPDRDATVVLQSCGISDADELLKEADRLPQSEEAAGVYRLRAAEIAWHQLASRTASVKDIKSVPDEQLKALRILRAATEKLIPLFVGEAAPRERHFSYGSLSYRIKASQVDKPGVYRLAALARVKPVDQVPHKLVLHWYSKPGVGAPLSPTWKLPNDPRLQRFVGNGYLTPITVVLDFQDRAGKGQMHTGTLTAYDPTAVSRVRVGRAEYPIAADFSAPIVDQTIHISEFGRALSGLFNAHASEVNLSILEPYDRGRIPVIFVHGLNSHARMWRDVVNDLRADPALRGRYQFWVFLYPTGLPISYSALRLREELAALDKVIGRQRDIVLIGHSMGGLLSRMQVINPGRAIWDAQLKTEADALYARSPANGLLKRALLFNANPEIGRVIFIATPHRGSRLADAGFAGLFAGFVRLPFVLNRLAVDLPTEILESRRLTSIKGLSPTNPLFAALERVPIEVPHHSIIGDRGKGDTPNSSDGVVPYWSSHLASAQSELIVPDYHGAYDDPKAIEEMRRILKMHLAKAGNRGEGR